jgi:transposase
MQIPLSEENFLQLKIIHQKTKDKKDADRIKIILLANNGYNQEQIASILFINKNTISYWIQKFYSSSSIKDWIKKNFKPYSGKLKPAQIEQVKNYIKENILIDVKPVITFIKSNFNIEYSRSGITKLLRSIGFTYKQLSLFPSKADIEKQKEFIRNYQALRENLNEKDVIVFIDGVHPQHNTKPVAAWIEKGTMKHIKTNTGRSRINLNGAYNPDNQDVIIREDKSINTQSTIKLFQQIENKYDDAPNIYAISDNAKYYKNQLIKEYQKGSRISLIFLPSYSPNLNLIERLWKFMRKKVINTTYYQDFLSFKTAILNFFANIEIYKNELKQFIGTEFHLIEPIF